MPSNGLMVAGGIGNALTAGVDAFLRARGMKLDEEERRRQALAQEQQMGLMAAKEGMVFSPELGRFELTPEGRDQREMSKKREDAELGLIGAQTRAYNTKAKGGKGDGTRSNSDLAPDERAELTTLGTRAANKRSIADQIDAFMGTWDELPDDQKVVQGLQILKVLNSSEGADAVGREEAERLGAKIEFALGFNKQRLGEFGRDLEGFATQARDTSKNLRAASNASRARADEIMGRKPSTGLMQSPAAPPAKPKPAWALR